MISGEKCVHKRLWARLTLDEGGDLLRFWCWVFPQDVQRRPPLAVSQIGLYP